MKKKTLTISFVILASIAGCGNTTAPSEMKAAERLPNKGISSVKYVSYTVESGDTISEIAEKYATHWEVYAPTAVVAESIKEYNAEKLYNGYLLQTGTVLKIPIWIKK